MNISQCFKLKMSRKLAFTLLLGTVVRKVALDDVRPEIVSTRTYARSSVVYETITRLQSCSNPASGERAREKKETVSRLGA